MAPGRSRSGHRANGGSRMRITGPGQRTTRFLVVITAALALCLSDSAASARLGSFHDAKDARTRLDVADVSLRFHPETRRYTWRFTTYERFRLGNGGSFLLFVDSVGAGRWDYRLHIWDDSGSSGVYCDGLRRAGAGGGRRFGPTSWHIEPSSAWCRFKGIRRDKPIRWRVVTVREQQRPFGAALDRAPNVGWF
jgi:hypothetical protein